VGLELVARLDLVAVVLVAVAQVLLHLELLVLQTQAAAVVDRVQLRAHQAAPALSSSRFQTPSALNSPAA
jgi:hypothetical protein